MFILFINILLYPRMMKQLLQRQRKKVGTVPPLNIHELTTADFSDSDLSDDQVVMLSWNNGKVGLSDLLELQKLESNINNRFI